MVKDSWLPALDKFVMMGNQASITMFSLKRKKDLNSVTTQRHKIITVTTQEIISVHVLELHLVTCIRA